MKIAALIVLLLSQVSFATAGKGKIIKLNDANFEENTAGKFIFIKFYAPWCGACTDMDEAYGKLADDWADDENVIVVEMDCEAKDSYGVCYSDPFNVEEYPTMWWGDPKKPERYLGHRDYEAMSIFAKEHLGNEHDEM